jgi:hypothetical protein
MNHLGREFTFLPAMKKYTKQVIDKGARVNPKEVKEHYIKLIKQSIARRAIVCQTQVVANGNVYSDHPWAGFMAEV